MEEVKGCSPFGLGYGKTKKDTILWMQHRQQVAQSGGFDFDIIPPHSPFVWNPINPFDDFTVVEPFVMKAIEEFNAENEEDYLFVEVKKVNRQPVDGYLYYITFEAVKEVDAVEDDSVSILFEALVYEPISGDAEVEFCRYKPFRGWRPFLFDTKGIKEDKEETKKKQKKKKKGKQRTRR